MLIDYLFLTRFDIIIISSLILLVGNLNPVSIQTIFFWYRDDSPFIKRVILTFIDVVLMACTEAMKKLNLLRSSLHHSLNLIIFIINFIVLAQNEMKVFKLNIKK